MTLPPGWQWPDRTPEGLYWFRSIILHHIIEHVLSYKDTADFHVTDLIRFANLHHLFEGQRDPRVPEYIRRRSAGPPVLQVLVR